jgi:hypothetical protein
MKLWKRWHLGRGVVAAGAGLLLIAGLATPASAATRPFNAQVVAGNIAIGSAANVDIAGTPACSDGEDNEYDAPFTPTKDTLIDFPADPQCSSPFDNDEKLGGFQAAVPITLTGTIDDSTGAFSVPASNFSFPATTLTITSPVPAFDANATTANSTVTGTLTAGGAMSFSSINLNFAIQLCIPAFGCTNPPPPYGTGPAWSANCNVTVNPPALNTSDPGYTDPETSKVWAGTPYFPSAGVATVVDTDFFIDTPADGSPPGAIPCAGLSGTFGLPSSTNDLAFQVMTNKAVGQAKSITVGNATVSEAGPDLIKGKPGLSKLTFPVTVNTAPLTDLTFNLSTVGAGAVESAKPAPANVDFTSLDGKVGKIKAGKTIGKVSVNVLSDSLTEGDESVILNISSPSDPSYTLVHSSALGTIHDRTAANKVSIYGGDTPEGSNAAIAPLKPATTTATFPLVMSTQQATDTTVTYCTQQITASPNTGKGKGLVIDDYSPIDCALPKSKIIKAGKLFSTITVKVNQDSTVEPDEAFAVVILNVAGSPATADAAHSAGIGLIKTDD